MTGDLNHQSLGIYGPWTTRIGLTNGPLELEREVVFLFCKGQRVIDVRLLYILINREEIQEIQLQLIQDDNGLGSFPLGPAKRQMAARKNGFGFWSHKRQVRPLAFESLLDVFFPI